MRNGCNEILIIVWEWKAILSCKINIIVGKIPMLNIKIIQWKIKSKPRQLSIMKISGNLEGYHSLQASNTYLNDKRP